MQLAGVSSAGSRDEEKIAPNAAEADRNAEFSWKSFEACKEMELPGTLRNFDSVIHRKASKFLEQPTRPADLRMHGSSAFSQSKKDLLRML